MSSRQPSWREVATLLAGRLEHAAGAAGTVTDGDTRDGAGCSHTVAEADPDNCPFCADRAAFQVYQAKTRSVTRPNPSDGGAR